MLTVLLSGVETGGARAVVALIFTALLGIAGYIVQSKNAISNAPCHSRMIPLITKGEMWVLRYLIIVQYNPVRQL